MVDRTDGDLKQPFGDAAVWYQRGAHRLRSGGRFANDPCDEERLDWALVYDAFASWRLGEGKRIDAYRSHAICEAKWLLRSPSVSTGLPMSNEWREEVSLYIGIMDRLREHRESKISAASNAAIPIVDGPSADEMKRAKEVERSFTNWYQPIEDHQTSCHRTFCQLVAFAGYAYRDQMESILQRGDELNDRLSTVLSRGILRWLPIYSLHLSSDAYVPVLFKAKGNWNYRDVSEWWFRFRRHSDQYLPIEPILSPEPTIGFGLDDHDDGIPF